MYCTKFLQNCIDYISSFWKEFYYEFKSDDRYNDALSNEEIITLVPKTIINMKPSKYNNTEFDDGFEFIDKIPQDIV